MKGCWIWAMVFLLPSSFLEGQTRTPALYDAWVTFTDKGLDSEAAQAEALAELERTFDAGALARRRLRRTLPGLFDNRDLPLHAPYLQAVAHTGAEVRVESRWLNGISVLADRQQLDAIEALPFVAEVTDLHPHVPKDQRTGRIPNDPDLRRGPPPESAGMNGWAATQLHQLDLDRLHEAGFQGMGVIIAVIDTGFLLSHPAFHNPSMPMNVLGQWDFVDNDPQVFPGPDDTPDFHEHGSLVLGALAANAPGELMGSAPEAGYILLRAEDDATEYFLEERWFVAALEFAEAHGADIVSSSLVLYEGYGPGDVDGATSVMAQGWNLATGNGIIGLQGGGNSGHDRDPRTHHLLPPAGAPQVITVGAVDSEGEVAVFSSDGLPVQGAVKPELLALGRGTATISPYEKGAYTTSAGTSMATPVLAGGVACLLQAHPNWSVKEVREALFQSGDFFRANGRPDSLFIQGYGVPDLFRATFPGREPQFPETALPLSSAYNPNPTAMQARLNIRARVIPRRRSQGLSDSEFPRRLRRNTRARTQGRVSATSGQGRRATIPPFWSTAGMPKARRPADRTLATLRGGGRIR